MGYAVQLYFNAELEAALLKVRKALTEAGIPPTLERLGDRPHVSLAVANSLDAKSCIAMLESFANDQVAFPAEFAAFGAFPTAQGVVYLSPTPSGDLIRVHRRMNERLKKLHVEVHEHYAPDGWMPHATIGFELTSTEVAFALSWLHGNLKPIEGTFASVGLIEFIPVKELATFKLRALTTAPLPRRARAARAGKARR